MLRSFFREGQSCLHCIKPIICIRSSRQPLCSTQWSTPNINQCLSQRHSERRTCNFLHKGARCANIQPCSAVSAEKHFVHGSLKCRKKLKCFKKNHYLWKQLCGRWHCMVFDSFSNVQSGSKFCVSNCFYLHSIFACILMKMQWRKIITMITSISYESECAVVILLLDNLCSSL